MQAKQVTAPTTGKTVVDRLLRKQFPERVGLNESYWPGLLPLWLDQSYPTDGAGNPCDPVTTFGYDLAGVGGFFDIAPFRGQYEIVEETDEWVVKRNGAGATLRWWKHKSGTPEHLDFHMSSREVWEQVYRQHMLDLDKQRVDGGHSVIAGIDMDTDVNLMCGALEARRAQGLWTFAAHVFCWEAMRQSLGDICMYESFLADPDWIRDYNQVHTDFFRKHFAYMFEKTGLPDGVWLYEDLAYRNGLFCAPEVLRELLFPYYAELVDFFHGYGLPVVLHSCGNVTDALPLIVDAGFDGLNPMEVKAGCDLLQFAETYGDSLTFFGGLDVRILEFGDRDHIQKSVEELMTQMKRRHARWVFGSDHSLSPQVTYDAYRYALDAYHKHKFY